MNILEKMDAHQSEYSQSELKVYKTIRDNPEIVRHATITKIAQLSGSSVSAIQRFCKTIGYHGYKEFHFEMNHFLNKSSSHRDNQIVQMTDAYVSLIQNMKNLNEERLIRLAKAIVAAPHVYLFGIYSSALAARKLSYNLIDQGIIPITGEDHSSIGHLINLVNDEDLVIIFSQSGNNPVYHELKDHSLTALITCSSKQTTEMTFSLPLLPELSPEILFMVFDDLLGSYVRRFL